MTEGKLSVIAASLAVVAALFSVPDVDRTPRFGGGYQRRLGPWSINCPSC